MNLYTTANIEIIDENLTKVTARGKHNLRNDLQEAFAAAADAVLARHGIVNGLMHTVEVEEIEIDESDSEA